MSDQLLFDAIAFAARAHRHQLRKDGQTPYISHVMRVAMVVRQVFNISDPKILAAAVLHDTIEDTPTDYDDVADLVGDEVAGWVAALTKDMRLPDAERETAYAEQLVEGGWPVWICKLADVYDNLGDSRHLSAKGRERTIARSRQYLNVIRPHVSPTIESAFRLVEARCEALARELLK